MIAHSLMSDKRATYAIGAVAVTLALVLGLVTAIPASTTVNTVSMGMLGHATVVLKDTDGNIKAYQQTDNIVVLNGQDCSADLLFGVFEGGLCAGAEQIWDEIGIGSRDSVALDTETDLIEPIPSVGAPDRTGALTGETAATTGGGGTGALKQITGTFILTAAETIAEVGLFDGVVEGAEMFSRINLGVPISAGSGDTVTITYVIEVG